MIPYKSAKINEIIVNYYLFDEMNKIIRKIIRFFSTKALDLFD